jgi:ABC-2 type transport system ATP-binding protein
MLSIEVKNLIKTFKDTIAVNDVSFYVEEGQCFGLLGPNGAGKTTTLNVLATLLKLTSGSAKVAGFDVSTQKNDVRKNIGMVFQEPALDSKLTGRENLEFHAMMYGIEPKVYKKRIDSLLSLVELKEKENVMTQNYSGGMKRRLEIARGLIHRPKVLFLDEPTLGLDSQTRRLIWNYVKSLIKEYKVTVILTTHYMEEADFLCDRIAIIDHGKIIVNDTPDSLKAACGTACSLEDVFLKYVGTDIRNVEEREKIW